jgi:hypothetical protein
VRRAVLLAVLALPLAAPGIAHAGSYDVVACTGSVGTGNAFTAAADPGMAAYPSCPNTPSNPASGLVTRASANAGGARVPVRSGAYQIFEAPAGAGLESVTFDLAAIRLASYWTIGVVAYDGDFNDGDQAYGCFAGQVGCGIGTPAFFGPVHVGLNGRSRFRFETRCGEPSGCDVSAAGGSVATRALLSAANVVVRVRDSSPPAIVVGSGAVWQDGWHRGVAEGWQGLYDNVGVMALRLYADGALVWAQDYRDPAWPDWVRCNFTRARPCSDIGHSGVVLDTRTLADGDHALKVETVDAAGNVSAIERGFKVDNTAPDPVEASIAGGDGWRRTNDFSVRWTPPAGGASPITRSHYSLCRLPPVAPCTRGSRTGVAISNLDGLSVPSPGEYSLRLWLEDEAGNANEANASAEVRLRMDDVAPDGKFELLDEADPRRLDVRVFDIGSGVTAGTIELRRSGNRQWHELATTLDAGGLHAYVDDDGLPDGTYEARAIVRDGVANERIIDRREDGERMSLSLPLRAQSRIALTVEGRSKRCRRRRGRRCPRPRALVLRGSGIVRGAVTSAGGDPLARSAVTVAEQSRTPAVPRRTQTLVTDGAGRFEFRAGAGPSRTLRFRFPGTALLKPAVAEANVLVPARSTISVSRRYLLNGQTVAFAGRLVGRPVPDGGKLIDLQAFYRNRWRTIATPRADQQGKWTFRYRFEATSGLVRYRFRARIRRETAYPYELGYSRVARVTVRGP